MHHSSEEALRAKGLKATPQRLAIYQALLGTRAHPSVETVFKQVRSDFPTISLNTVYTNLCSLVRVGLARKIDAGDGLIRYDGNPDPHAHIVCSQCQRVDDIDAEPLDGVRLPSRQQISDVTGYEVHDYAVYVYGLCPSCRSGANLAVIDLVSALAQTGFVSLSPLW